jgi:probable RNA-binding protein EIF1AD
MVSKNRKHITQQVLHNYPEPKPNEHIVRVTATRGTNQIEVEYPSKEKTLAMLPMKFNKLIWIKRGDYLIISTSHVSNRGKIKGLIRHVLLEQHVIHLKKVGIWPEEFTEKTPHVIHDNEESNHHHHHQQEQQYNDDEQDDEEELDDPVFINPNRRNYDEESDDEDSSSDDEE